MIHSTTQLHFHGDSRLASQLVHLSAPVGPRGWSEAKCWLVLQLEEATIALVMVCCLELCAALLQEVSCKRLWVKRFCSSQKIQHTRRGGSASVGF